MAVSKREIRRIAGVLNARLPETRLDRIADPRNEKGRRWRLNTLLSAVMLGLMTRRQNLAETESLTEEMSVGMRRMLHIPRRVPDTTMRDALVEMEPTEVRGSIHAQMRAAHRRKALVPSGLPFGVVAMDGKVTAVDNADGYYAQDQGDYGLVRTITCSLVSSPGKPCIDAISQHRRTRWATSSLRSRSWSPPILHYHSSKWSAMTRELVRLPTRMPLLRTGCCTSLRSRTTNPPSLMKRVGYWAI